MNFITLQKSLLAAAMIAAIAVPAIAKAPAEVQTDSLIRDRRIITFGEGEEASPSAVDSLILNFYYDQFRHFQDPAAPYFLFMSKDAGLAMGVGGCVRMRGYVDWGGALPASGFAPYLIPTGPDDPLKERSIGTTPAGSSLFFRVIGRNKKLGNYQLYIEANFNGYSSRDFHLKKAYATLNDVTIGYANSTFSDPSALPPVIDAQGPNVKMARTAVLIRWMHTWRDRWTVAASVESPEMAQVNGGDGTAVKRDQYVPDISAFVQYQWNRSEHVRLAAIGRQLPYRDMKVGRNHTIVGWGLQLSSVFRPVEPLTVYFTINGGKGYAGLGGDLLIGNYDLLADPLRPGRAYAPASWGYYAGLQYNFRPNLFLATTFGQARFAPDMAVASSEYKYGLYSATTLIWNLTPRIQAGAEFDIGKRQNFDGSHGWARRAGLMAQFSF